MVQSPTISGIQTGVIIIVHNPSEVILKRSLDSLKQISYQIDLNVVIVDSSDSVLDLKYPESENFKVIITRTKNLGFCYSANLGINKILKQQNVKFIMLLEDDADLIADNLVKAVELFLNFTYINYSKDLLILNDSLNNNSPIQLKKTLNSEYFGITCYFGHRDVFQAVKFRSEFFMDQNDFDFQCRVRERGGVIYIPNFQILERLKIGRNTGKFPILPIWRVFTYARNSSFLFREKRISVTFFIRELIWIFPTLAVNFLKFPKMTATAFVLGLVRGLSGEMNIQEVFKFRHI